jgi:hypothetical protein
VQHERQPLGRRQSLQYDEQREPDRVRLHRFEFGIGYVDILERGGVVADRLFGSATPRTQHVEADPPDDRGQPAAQILDRVGVGPAEPDPGLLDGILGFGCGAQDAERDHAEVFAVFLEPVRQPVVFTHLHHVPLHLSQSRPGAVMGVTRNPPYM